MPSPPNSPNPIVGAAGFVFLMAVVWSWVWVIARLRRGSPILPRDEPGAVPWGAGSIALVILAFLGIGLLAEAGYLIVARPGRLEIPPVVLLELAAIRNAGVLLAVPLILRATSRARLADLGLGPAPIGRNVIRGIVACLLFLPGIYGIGLVVMRIWHYQTHPLEKMIRADPSGPIALLAIVSGVIFAPVAEELLFRGVLQGWLARVWGGRSDRNANPIEVWIEADPSDPTSLEAPSVWAPPKAPLGRPDAPASGSRWARAMPNVATSAIFAAIHLGQWPAPIPLFLLSLGLGALYQRTGSLIAPITMHATFNGLSTLALFVKLTS